MAEAHADAARQPVKAGRWSSRSCRHAVASPKIGAPAPCRPSIAGDGGNGIRQTRAIPDTFSLLAQVFRKRFWPAFTEPVMIALRMSRLPRRRGRASHHAGNKKSPGLPGSTPTRSALSKPPNLARHGNGGAHCPLSLIVENSDAIPADVVCERERLVTDDPGRTGTGRGGLWSVYAGAEDGGCTGRLEPPARQRDRDHRACGGRQVAGTGWSLRGLQGAVGRLLPDRRA